MCLSAPPFLAVLADLGFQLIFLLQRIEPGTGEISLLLLSPLTYLEVVGLRSKPHLPVVIVGHGVVQHDVIGPGAM